MTHLESFSASKNDFDAKSMFTAFSVDIIAYVGIGVEAKAIQETDNIFRKKVCNFCLSKVCVRNHIYRLTVK